LLDEDQAASAIEQTQAVAPGAGAPEPATQAGQADDSGVCSVEATDEAEKVPAAHGVHARSAVVVAAAL
jgi:hypothetical protein